MRTFIAPRRFAIAAMLAISTLGIASTVHARSNVSISIGLQVPGGAAYYPASVYVSQRPVYMQSRPIYVQPRPVYVQPQVIYVQPQPVYLQPAPVFIRPRPVLAYPPAVGYYYPPTPHWRQGQWKKLPKHGFHGNENGYGHTRGQGRDRD